MNRQFFHLVESSPWPFTGSLGAFTVVSGLATWFHFGTATLIFFGVGILVVTSVQWWRDVCRESTFMGYHNSRVASAHQFGFILFVVSEVFFFVSFFWAYFHFAWSASPILGGWPPTGIVAINPWGIPLLNTFYLLSSGVSVTWAHHSMLCGEYSEVLSGLKWAVVLGIIFTAMQLGEYKEASFTIADGVYGSIFYLATGFHGLHVIIGTIFLSVCWFRTGSVHFSPVHHVGLEASIWYWHFVDVVWLLLFISIYARQSA